MYFIRPRLRRIKLGRPKGSLLGQEVDAVRQAKYELSSQGGLKGDHELDAKQTALAGHEIDSRPYSGAELEGQSRRPIFEMAAREEPASEMSSTSDPKPSYPYEPTTEQTKE